ncbi:MAG TPA: PIN domain-containing protein [Tepidisphaeraceae bacterium]|nr:PIN domain-containing protein [Tepidisphaeraceae bacterium]
MIFVDTSGWYAAMVPQDPRHSQVLSWLKSNTQRLVTTDYIIDESLTLLRARGHSARAILLGRRAFDLSAFNVVLVKDSDLNAAWSYFNQNPDRQWSFTDCTSKVVIERFHIHQALTFDRHFLEFGNLTLVP